MSSFESFMESDTFFSFERPLTRKNSEVWDAIHERRRLPSYEEKKEFVVSWLNANAELWKQSTMRAIHMRHIAERNKFLEEKTALKQCDINASSSKRSKRSTISAGEDQKVNKRKNLQALSKKLETKRGRWRKAAPEDAST